MGTDRTVDTGDSPPAHTSRAQATGQSQGAEWHLVCAQDWHPVGRPAAGTGLRLGDDVLASAECLAESWRMAAGARSIASQAARCRSHRLVFGSRGQFIDSGVKGGEHTGPNPTDRARAGSKHHLITDATGLPLAVGLTGANTHDVTQLLPLVDAIPPVRGKPGRPRRRPDGVLADRAYDSAAHRQALRVRHIEPWLAQRRVEHGSGLGRYRWVVERTFAWLHQFRRLRIRFERYAHIHQAFLSLGCALICWRALKLSFC